MSKEDKDPVLTDAPPFFKSWRGMYLLLIGFLIFQIILYYILTQTLQ